MRNEEDAQEQEHREAGEEEVRRERTEQKPPRKVPRGFLFVEPAAELLPTVIGCTLQRTGARILEDADMPAKSISAQGLRGPGLQAWRARGEGHPGRHHRHGSVGSHEVPVRLRRLGLQPVLPAAHADTR